MRHAIEKTSQAGAEDRITVFAAEKADSQMC